MNLKQQIGWLFGLKRPVQPAPPLQADWQDLIRQHNALPNDQPRAQELRLDFIRTVVADTALLADPAVASFLAETMQAADFIAFNWESAETILLFCNRLYTFPFADPALREPIREHVHTLFRHVLQTYESKKAYEELFNGVQLTPTFALWDDEELKRLRHLAYRYEVRRVTHNRRWLYAYLIIQVLLVVFIFPLLFINAENGALQAKVEELTDVEIGDEGYHLLSYPDALYWSIITATSIGYGDITPTTFTGRIIAAVLGTMGVITIGIMTGLVLDWITPRRLD